MGIFSLTKGRPVIKGLIGYYALSEWWLSEFSEEERNHIENTYTPMGGGGDLLTKVNIEYWEDEEGGDINGSVVKFLWIFAGWFDNKKDRRLAIIILVRAEESLSDEIPLMDFHFLYHQLIKTHYSNRNNDPKSFDKSIKACEQQIEIASKVAKAFKEESKDGFMPSHTGYNQLIIVKEKEKKYQAVMDLCTKAQKEGWRGDWEHRIERCKKKLNKLE
ncbi:MAG TPA: hypothetical protein VIK55_17505 [Paludibacter sp.]